MLEESELPVRPQTRGIRGLERPCYTETIYTSTLSKNFKKRRAPASRSRKSKGALLDAYVLQEKEKCQKHGLPCPEQDFDLVMTQASKGSPSIEDNRKELKIFFFAIASSESLVALRDIVQAHRRRLAGNLLQVGCDIPQAERVKVIERLNENIAYFSLLKRCHVHRLFIDSSRSSRKTTDGFINNTSQNIATLQSSKSGNPNHIEGAETTKAIMKEVFPNLKDSAEYEKKYRTISNLRKLGQRLNLLVERFGYGIIGLLPSGGDASTVDPILNISDNK
jgi:hypothetical protein